MSSIQRWLIIFWTSVQIQWYLPDISKTLDEKNGTQRCGLGIFRWEPLVSPSSFKSSAFDTRSLQFGIDEPELHRLRVITSSLTLLPSSAVSISRYLFIDLTD
jgi:hypothetical protein